MYRLISPSIIIENIMVLSAPYLSHKTPTETHLKKAYREYLKKIQPYCPLIDSEQLFYADSETDYLFTDYFSESEVDMTKIYNKIDLNSVMYPNANNRLNIIKKSLAFIEEKDALFVKLFKLIINTVFCSLTQHLGGTSVNPKYIGVICAHHDMHGEENAIPELLIHEFTHHTVLLDERRYGHYKGYDLLKNPDTHIEAEDRGVKFKFPLDRILHSMLVGAEIILARDAYIGHSAKINQHVPTHDLVARSIKYIEQIENNPLIKILMTTRGDFLYRLIKKFYLHRKLD